MINKPLASSNSSRPAVVVGLRGSVWGLYLTLRCRGCRKIFEVYQPTVAGIAVGGHVCPQCGVRSEVLPETLEEALVRFFPSYSYQEMAGLTEEAARLAENWHQVKPLPRVLSYRGINLGEPTERWLAAFFVQGLLQTLKDGGEEA